MKMRLSLCVFALGLTHVLVGQNNSTEVHVTPKETVPVFEHCGHIEEDAHAQQTCFNRFIMSHIMNELHCDRGWHELSRGHGAFRPSLASERSGPTQRDSRTF